MLLRDARHYAADFLCRLLILDAMLYFHAAAFLRRFSSSPILYAITSHLRCDYLPPRQCHYGMISEITLRAIFCHLIIRHATRSFISFDVIIFRYVTPAAIRLF